MIEPSSSAALCSHKTTKHHVCYTKLTGIPDRLRRSCLHSFSFSTALHSLSSTLTRAICRPPMQVCNVIPVLHLTSPDLAQHPAEGQHTLSTANFSKQWTQSVQHVCCTTKRVPATFHKQNERMCACKCTCIVDKLGLITSTVVDMLANESLTALSCAARFGTSMSATLKASALTGGLELCGSGDVGGDAAGVESADVSLSDPTTDFGVLWTRPMPVISLGNSSTTLCRVLRVSAGLLDSESWLCSTSMLSCTGPTHTHCPPGLPRQPHRQKIRQLAPASPTMSFP